MLLLNDFANVMLQHTKKSRTQRSFSTSRDSLPFKYAALSGAKNEAHRLQIYEEYKTVPGREMNAVLLENKAILKKKKLQARDIALEINKFECPSRRNSIHAHAAGQSNKLMRILPT